MNHLQDRVCQEGRCKGDQVGHLGEKITPGRALVRQVHPWVWPHHWSSDGVKWWGWGSSLPPESASSESPHHMKICPGWENTKREALLTRYMTAALSTPRWLVPLHSLLGQLCKGCTKSFLEAGTVRKKGVNHLSLPCRSPGSWYTEGTQMFILWNSATQHSKCKRNVPRTYGCQRGRMEGRQSLGVWDGHGNTAVFKMENPQGPMVEHREPCSMLCGSLDGRGFGGDWVCAYVWLSPFAVHLKLTFVNRLYPKTKYKV